MSSGETSASQWSTARTPRIAASTAVPNSSVMKSGRTAVTLMDCMAAIPCEAGSRLSPAITKVEKAKNTPPAVAVPTAVMRVRFLIVDVMCRAHRSLLRRSIAVARSFIRDRLRFGHGRDCRPAGVAAGAGCFPASLDARAAVVAADPGRGTADGDGGRLRQRVGAAGERGARAHRG